jgi:DNA (cytosine-5)-methyltransferase 1
VGAKTKEKGNMNELALFAGGGCGILAGGLIGWRTRCAVEIDVYSRGVLLARQNEGVFPGFPIWDDIRTFDGMLWRGAITVVSGGFPCQAFSTASRGRRTAENLWPEMFRVVREVEPPIVFAENVSKAAIEAAAEDLESVGFSCKAVKIGAEDVGADHVRARYWLLAYTNDEGELLCRQYAEVASGKELQTSVWETEPGSRRVDDGVARRVDRYRLTGNGWVPFVATKAWHVLCQEAAAEHYGNRPEHRPTAAVCNTA